MLRLRGQGSRNPVEHLTFSPDGTQLVSASRFTPGLWLWDRTTGGPLLLGVPIFPSKPAFSPDGSLLASAMGNGVVLWDASGAEERRIKAPSAIRGLCFLPDGRLALVGSLRLFLCRLPEGDLSRGESLPRQDPYLPPASAPAAGLLATVHRQEPYPFTWALCVRKIDTGETSEFTTAKGYPSELALSGDGRFLALATDRTLRVWDVSSRKAVLERQPNTYFIKAVAFSQDGKYLATGSNDQTVRLWDTRTWGECAAFNWEIGRVTALAFSPDGMRAAAGSYTGKIVVWDVDL